MNGEDIIKAMEDNVISRAGSAASRRSCIESKPRVGSRRARMCYRPLRDRRQPSHSTKDRCSQRDARTGCKGQHDIATQLFYWRTLQICMCFGIGDA